MSWAEEARKVIGRVDQGLPAEATIEDRRRALRAVAYDYHWGTSWGRKVWSKEVRRYLQQHGLAPLQRPVEASPLFGPDIIFPFRAGGA